MRHRRIVLSCALSLMAAFVVTAAALAVPYDGANLTPDPGPDPLARSPRLLGLAGFTLLGNDPHNRITMWDFAGQPVGVASADSVSTMDLRPGTTALSALEDLDPSGARMQQTLAARDVTAGYEIWRRTPGVAFGAIGDFSNQRVDTPYSADQERRSSLSPAWIMPVIAGTIPYLKSGKWSYGLNLLVGRWNNTVDYRGLVSNTAGEYIDRDGTLLNPPDVFEPVDSHVNARSLGASLAYRAGRSLTAALGGNLTSADVIGRNEGPRYATEVSSTRPYALGQGTLIGHIGKSFEWGADGRLWSSNSQDNWAFTVSGGIGNNPLNGRGKLLERDEKGRSVNARARWLAGPFELSVGGGTSFRKSVITPPDTSDRTSFNYFLSTLSAQAAGDTLAIPDSVSYNDIELRSKDFAGGVSMQLPGHHGLLGVEYHTRVDDRVQTISGHGPRREIWDVRAGVEYRFNHIFTGRGGYRYTHDDHDALTLNNATIGNAMTLGFGIYPGGATWSVETGYVYEWLKADYGDPGQPTAQRQQLAAQLHWNF